MKKFLIMVVFALTTLNISAQEESRFNFIAGVGMSSVVGSDADTKLTIAYKVGLLYDLKAAENFYVIPGIEFVAKGFKSDNVDGAVNMSYIEIPIVAAYKFDIADGMKLVIKAGPYAAYGIFGSDLEFKNGKKINIFDKDDGIKRFDAGALGGIGLEFEQFTIGAEYSRGFIKLDSNYTQYNQAFGLVFGYKF